MTTLKHIETAKNSLAMASDSAGNGLSMHPGYYADKLDALIKEARLLKQRIKYVAKEAKKKQQEEASK